MLRPGVFEVPEAVLFQFQRFLRDSEFCRSHDVMVDRLLYVCPPLYSLFDDVFLVLNDVDFGCA